MILEPANGLGTQLRHLLELLDGDLEQIYREDGFDYRPRYTPIMKVLADGAPHTIKDIALRSSVSHSAASQTISKMSALGFVDTQSGVDCRERLIKLSPKGHQILPALKRRWAATQTAATSLDNELSMPLSKILQEAIDALTQQSFSARILSSQKELEDTHP